MTRALGHCPRAFRRARTPEDPTSKSSPVGDCAEGGAGAIVSPRFYLECGFPVDSLPRAAPPAPRRTTVSGAARNQSLWTRTPSAALRMVFAAGRACTSGLHGVECDSVAVDEKSIRQ